MLIMIFSVQKTENSKYTLRKVSVGVKPLGGITKVIKSYEEGSLS